MRKINVSAVNIIWGILPKPPSANILYTFFGKSPIEIKPHRDNAEESHKIQKHA